MQLFTLCSCKWFVFIVLATDAWLWTNVECRVQVLHEQPLQPALTRLSGQLRLVKVKKVTKLLTDDDEHDDTTEHGRAKEPLTSVASDRHHSKLTPKTTHVDLNVKMDAIAFRPMPFLAPQKTTTDLTSDFISKSKPISIPFTTVAPFRIKRPKFELKPKSTSINLPAPNRPLKVKTNDALNVKLKNRAKQTKSNASMGMRKETKFAKSNSNSNANRESKKLEKIHKTSATNSNHRKALQSKVEDKKIDYDSIRAKLNLQKKTQKAIDSSSSYNYSIQRAREEKGEKKKKTGSGSTSASKPKYASTQTLKPNHEAKSQKSVQTKAPSTTMNRAKEQGDLQQENSNTFRKYAKLSFRGESSRKVAVATDLATTSTSTTTESPTTRTWSRSNGERPSTFDRQPANDSNRFGLSRKRKRFGSESIKSENDRAKSSQAVTTTERSFTTAESVKRDIFKFRSRKHLEGPKYPRFQSTTTSQPSIITTSIKTKFEANAKDDNDLIGSNEIVKSKDQGPAKFGLMATRRKPLRKFLRSSAGFEATVQPFSTRSKNPLASGITSTTTSTTTTTTTTAVPTTTTSTESSVFTRRPRIRRPTPETGSRALQTTLITTSTSTSTITPISSIIRNARRFQHSLPSVVVESGLFDERDQNTLKSRYSNATEYKLRRPTLEPDSMMMSPRSKPTEPSSKLHYSAPQRAPPLQSPSSHQNENVIDDTAEKSTSLPVAPSSSVRQNVFDSQRIRNIDRTPSYEVITKFAPESKDVLPAQNAYHTKSSQTENDYSHRPDYLIEVCKFTNQ